MDETEATRDIGDTVQQASAERIVERIPGAKLVVLPEANHLFWIEKGPEAAGAIIDFIGGAG